MVLKGYFYVGAYLCTLCVSNVFGVRAGFDMDASHIFPHGVLAIITLIRGVVGVEESNAYAGCVVGLPLCFMAIATLSGVGPAPQLLE